MNRLIAALGLVVVLSAYDTIVALGPVWPAGLVLLAVWVVVGTVLDRGRLVVRYLAEVAALGATLWFLAPPPGAQPLEALRLAGRITWEEAPPVDPPPALVFALLLVLVLVLLVIEILDTTPVVMGVVYLAVLAVPTAVAAVPPPAPVVIGAGAAWLALLWWRVRADRPERAASGALVAAASLLAAVIVTPLVPTSQASGWEFGEPGPGAFGPGFNPMLELGQDLRRGATRTALTYTTTATVPQYLKIAALDDFDGVTWAPRERGDAPPEGGSGETESVTVTIDSLESNRVPVPYPATEVRDLDGLWRWVRPGETVALARGSTAGQRYSVDFVDRDLTAPDLRARTSGGVGDPQALWLPAEISPSIARFARQVTAGTDNHYDAMIALQNWFRTQFRYSETAPVREGYDGNGVDVVARFLRERQGYCVHFASSMAVMARTLGVPARVAVGYAPGSLVSAADDTRTWRNLTSDAHAWTEVWFEGVGWIGFDPTTSIGDPTDFPEEAGAASEEAAPTPEDTEAPPEREDALTDTAEDQGSESAAAGVPWWRVAAATIALVVLALVPAVARGVQRRRRAGVLGAWREVLDTAADLGRPIPPSATTNDAVDLLVRSGAPLPATADLAGLVDEALYARHPGAGAGTGAGAEGPAGLAGTVVAGLEAAASRRERVAARLWPRSLLTSVSRGRAGPARPRVRARVARSASD